MLHQNVIVAITPPNASVPGVLCIVEGLYSEQGWSPDVRGVTVRHVEWLDEPGNGVIPRIAEALKVAVPYWEKSRRDMLDPRLIVCTNFWASARSALFRAGLDADLIAITPGSNEGRGQSGQVQQVGRMLLIDELRDVLPKIVLNMPTEPVEGYGRLVLADELLTAFKELGNRPRLVDDESMAPGLSRHDSLVLSIGLAVRDLSKYGPGSCESPNQW